MTLSRERVCQAGRVGTGVVRCAAARFGQKQREPQCPLRVPKPGECLKDYSGHMCR
jgi:hypothetical protein